MNLIQILTNEKHFPKIIRKANQSLNMAWLQIYRKLLSFATFLRGILPQNKYPNLKTTCHIKLNFFLWIKRLDNFLRAKYLISVAVPLISASKPC